MGNSYSNDSQIAMAISFISRFRGPGGRATESEGNELAPALAGGQVAKGDRL